MSKTILVTGGAGFIGTNLCRYFLNQGDYVICLDNLYSGRESNISDLKSNPQFEFIHHDITQPINLVKIDQIYNLACPASPPAYQKNPIQTWKSSVFGIYNILELSRKNGNIPILHSSTSEIYGDPHQNPQKETYWGNVNPIGIRSCYDEGKRAAESLLFDYFRTYQLPIRVIRIFNTYGPFMDPLDGRVVSNFIIQALQNESITIYGDGSQTRSFQYIDDLIIAMDKMMNNDKNFIGPINLGNPQEFTIDQLAKIIKQVIPESTSQIIKKDLPQDDPKQRCPDISLAKEILNWEPKTNLEAGIIKTIEYFKTQI
jgi:UDP-glucuronate decarboxylase